MHLRVVTSSLVYDIRLRSSSVSAMEYRDSQSGFKVRLDRSAAGAEVRNLNLDLESWRYER